MVAILSAVVSILAFRFRGRASLELELVALRHQVTVLRRQRPGRPQLSSLDRLLWVWLYRIWPQVIDAMVLVKPGSIPCGSGVQYLATLDAARSEEESDGDGEGSNGDRGGKPPKQVSLTDPQAACRCTTAKARKVAPPWCYLCPQGHAAHYAASVARQQAVPSGSEPSGVQRGLFRELLPPRNPSSMLKRVQTEQ
jgi:hypothetical protein